MNGELGERITRVEERVRDIGEDVERIDRSINGPPRAESFRGRLHKLENDAAAASAAQAALEAAKAIQRQGWSMRERLGLFAFAAVGAFGTLLTLLDQL